MFGIGLIPNILKKENINNFLSLDESLLISLKIIDNLYKLIIVL